VARRGRPALSADARAERQGGYLLARVAVGRKYGRTPTLAEIADYMGGDHSERTLTSIRAEMRAWQRGMAAELGWDDPGDDIDGWDRLAGWTFEEDLTRAEYAAGIIPATAALQVWQLSGGNEP
jgi:hypothetical protein